MPMSLTIAVLVFLVVVYAIRSRYDLMLSGKLGFLSFVFRAQDRKSIDRTLLPHSDTTMEG